MLLKQQCAKVWLFVILTKMYQCIECVMNTALIMRPHWSISEWKHFMENMAVSSLCFWVIFIPIKEIDNWVDGVVYCVKDQQVKLTGGQWSNVVSSQTQFKPAQAAQYESFPPLVTFSSRYYWCTHREKEKGKGKDRAIKSRKAWDWVKARESCHYEKYKREPLLLLTLQMSLIHQTLLFPGRHSPMNWQAVITRAERDDGGVIQE